MFWYCGLVGLSWYNVCTSAITSNEIFALPALPQRVLIVGGGYIAVEFAGILNGLGAKVTQIYRGEMFLRGFDDDLRQGLATIMPTQGVDLRFNCNVSQIEQKEDGLHCTLTDGSTLVADQVLSAIDRSRREYPRVLVNHVMHLLYALLPLPLRARSVRDRHPVVFLVNLRHGAERHAGP